MALNWKEKNLNQPSLKKQQNLSMKRCIIL